jgi:hypothetical protein
MIWNRQKDEYRYPNQDCKITPKSQFLGHLSHSGDLLLSIFVRRGEILPEIRPLVAIKHGKTEVPTRFHFAPKTYY